MDFHASSHFTAETDSSHAATTAARALKEAFAGQQLRAVVAYASVTHDQSTIVRALRSELGPDVLLVGCSVQGVVGSGFVREGGYILSVMGLGGDSLQVATAVEKSIGEGTHDKGRSLGAQVVARLGGQPKACIVLYDPLCNADVEQMLGGLAESVHCPLIGAGASQPFGRIVRTYKYWQDEVLGQSALAIGLGGPLSAEIGVCHGSSPTGIVLTVTRAEGTLLLELDGRTALDVWRDVTGCTDEDIFNQDQISNWAIGIERTVTGPNGDPRALYFVRGAFGFDIPRQAVVVQAAIPEGARVMLHHRTTSAVTEGTIAMGQDLAARLGGRPPWAVLGFECGARTSPFLGDAATLAENLALQKAVSLQAPWIGMMAWGEIAPVAAKPAFHNYTYPLLVLSA